MSKPVKNLITETYRKRFVDLDSAVVIDIRGVASNDNNSIRCDLAQKQIKVTVVKNSLARTAFDGTGLAPLTDVLDGPSAMVYPVHSDVSVVTIARELITWAKQVPSLQFRGALMEGIVFTADQVDALSKYPTREEAQANVIQLLLSPARTLAAQVTSPGAKLASIIKTVQEKLEKGEAIAKAG